IGVSPSMGEEAGAVGGYKGGWGEYVDYPEFGSMYGVKKALQRGVFTTAALAIVLNAPLLLIFGALMPVAYYVGISIEQYRSGTNR
ncbi:hypothetical protein NL317_29875, partial [Klebsiella pneumoniae]|nr:hypothetical protein [Klebsiella pneumoniae]